MLPHRCKYCQLFAAMLLLLAVAGCCVGPTCAVPGPTSTGAPAGIGVDLWQRATMLAIGPEPCVEAATAGVAESATPWIEPVPGILPIDETATETEAEPTPTPVRQLPAPDYLPPAKFHPVPTQPAFGGP